jgi:Tudor domain
MTQLAFDHWFNILEDTSYADRCHQKKKLRQRKSPSGNYQVDEDVWARHPNDNIMYIASVIAVNNHHRTCHVAFVDDGQTFNVPVSHLRHVTREDIKRNRYVDYGHGWTERTSIGAINTYDRYGELQRVQFTGTSKGVFNGSFTVEDNDCINDDTINDISLSNDTTEDEVYIQGPRSKSTNEPIWVKISDPEEPTATYSNCPIWNASSYAEAEKKALELCNQDINYREAVERAERRKKASQLLVLLQLEELVSPQLHETSAETEVQLIESGSKSSLSELSTSKYEFSTDLTDQQLLIGNVNESEQIILSYHQQNHSQSCDYPEYIDCPKIDTSVNKSACAMVDQQVFFDNTQKEKHQSFISISDSKYFPTVKEVGIQTELSFSTSMANIDQRHKSIVMTYSNQLTKYVPTSTIRKKKRTCTWPSKYQLQILEDISSTTASIIDKQYKFWSRFRVNNSFTYVFTKLLPLILLAIMLSYHLMIGSSLTCQNPYSATITKIHRIPIDIIRRCTTALFFSTLPLSSILTGPSRSSYTLWFYPFAVP